MKVKILYKDYEIVEVENLHNAEGDLYGEIEYLSETIRINPAASTKVKDSTLIHEAVHAIDEMYGIGLKEKQVEKLGNAIYMMIVENEDLIKSITKNYKEEE